MEVLAWGYWVCVYSGHYVGVCGVLVVFFSWFDVFSSFFFCTSSCSGIIVHPALYDLL